MIECYAEYHFRGDRNEIRRFHYMIHKFFAEGGEAHSYGIKYSYLYLSDILDEYDDIDYEYDRSIDAMIFDLSNSTAHHKDGTGSFWMSTMRNRDDTFSNKYIDMLIEKKFPHITCFWQNYGVKGTGDEEDIVLLDTNDVEHKVFHNYA